jgi:hypothetical protein
VSTTNSCGMEAKEMGLECRSGGDKGTVGGGGVEVEDREEGK